MARLSESQAANDESSVALRILHLSTNLKISLIYNSVPEKHSCHQSVQCFVTDAGL